MEPRVKFGCSLRRILCDFLDLRAINIQMLNQNFGSSGTERPKERFFAQLHKFSRLKKVKLHINYHILQMIKPEDLDKFNRQPLKFRFCIKIRVEHPLKTGEKSILAKVLTGAEYVTIRDSSMCRGKLEYSRSEHFAIEKEEKKRMKFGKKQIVKIINWTDQEINATRILKRCDSLEHLFIRENRNLIQLKMSSQQEVIRGLRKLKLAALHFKHLFTNNSEENSICTSPLFEIYSQIKQKCLALQNLSLYLSEDFGWKKAQGPPFFRKYFSKFIQEVSTFNKQKTLGLLVFYRSFDFFPLNQILSNKNLESFQMSLRTSNRSISQWEGYFEYSQIKELKISLPFATKLPLFEVNLLRAIRALDNLQVVQLIDDNLEPITFDFLYGFVTSLLEKKCIRKIFICTKVINSFHSEDSEETLPKYLKAQFENMLSDISRELESRVNLLKDLQLEEMMIGKLNGYNFDLMLFSKEMGITDKLFWTQKEMDQISWQERTKTSIYRHLLYKFGCYYNRSR